MIITKDEFIRDFVKIVERTLNEAIKEEKDFEYKMFNEGARAVTDQLRHISEQTG